MSKDICQQIGEKLKKLRHSKGITQEWLAIELDVDKSYIGKIENANICISLRKLEKLAKILEVKISDFFD